MRLKRNSVTVMDNFTPAREFWTFGAALRYAARHGHAAHLFVWTDTGWRELQRFWLTNIHDR